ncbi:MAG: DDE-type integrase/transposase/recombinase [Coleofasciculus sp. B1-GNL1-01]|uniref:Mu transposase C-terminal domain-containing protein n=1 Tax=Coleofasciculus sp. B1-GNL1-01 TaxID=3068484 RepID=UPI0032F0C589
MLDGEQFVRWCQQLGLAEPTRKYIELLRSSPPSRVVRSRAGNVSGRYPSRKMGVTIQFESHHNELAGIYEMEYDPDVLEYYDQPSGIKLSYIALSGRKVGVLHTPDFFVLRQTCAGWEEWKTLDELVRLSVKMPARYVREGEGQWHCPPGVEVAQSLGLYYRIRCNAEIDWVFQNNLHFLEDYLHPSQVSVEEKVCAEIISRVELHPGITLGELLEEGYNCEEVYTLIAQNYLNVNWRGVNIAQLGTQIPIFPVNQKACRIETTKLRGKSTLELARNLVDLKPGSSVVWNGKSLSILNRGETHTALLNEEAKVIQLPNEALLELVKQGELTGVVIQSPSSREVNDLLAKASVDDCVEANRRYSIISPYLTGELQTSNQVVSARTIRRWLRSWRNAVEQYGCGYVGLLPRVSSKGNHQPKLPQTTQKIVDEFIDNSYLNLKQQGKFAVYSSLVRACSQQGITPCSYKTFVRKIQQKSNYEQAVNRQGRRAAYKHEPFYWELEVNTPRHGQRPFEICHIDHTQLDIELVSSHTSINLGRPWATFLTDAYSRRILAVYLCFDPPSYRSCMMVMRECVHRHGRLPDTIVVDGAKEFMSVYFERLLAAYSCTKKTRPAAKPRFGSVCERLFGTANTMFIHNLWGNTQINRNYRAVTKSVNPRNLAIWTLGSLYQNLCDWAYKFYDNKEHPALGQSPRAAFEDGLLQTGFRSHKLIPYDETFRILTLPTTPKGTAKVIPNQGVKINHIYYWHNSFRNPEIEKTQVNVRYDPYDAGIAYAYIKGQWVSCISQHYSRLVGHSEREIMVASEQLRQQQKNYSKQFTITAKALAEFLASTEAQEVILEQRLRDVEAKEVLAIIDGGKISRLQEQPPAAECLSLPISQEVSPNRDEIDSEEIEPYEEFW